LGLNVDEEPEAEEPKENEAAPAEVAGETAMEEVD
jgi:molecular chaperone HtpG